MARKKFVLMADRRFESYLSSGKLRYYGRLEVTVAWLEGSEAQLCAEDPRGEPRTRYYRDLVLSSYLTLDRVRPHDFGLAYEGAYRTDLDKARYMAATLSRVERAMSWADVLDGKRVAFGVLTAQLANAVGASALWLRHRFEQGSDAQCCGRYYVIEPTDWARAMDRFCVRNGQFMRELTAEAGQETQARVSA